jgi:hypothetical protein
VCPQCLLVGILLVEEEARGVDWVVVRHVEQAAGLVLAHGDFLPGLGTLLGYYGNDANACGSHNRLKNRFLIKTIKVRPEKLGEEILLEQQPVGSLVAGLLAAESCQEPTARELAETPRTPTTVVPIWREDHGVLMYAGYRAVALLQNVTRTSNFAAQF